MSVSALYASGRVHPLRPLARVATLPNRERFEALGRPIFESLKGLLRLAPLPPVLEPYADVIELERAAGRLLGFTRFDVVVPPGAPERFQVLEVQAGDPSAMGWHDALCEALHEPPTLMASHRRVFEALTDERRIAFVVVKDSIVESDHRLLAQHYAANGWHAVVADPRELHFDGQHLRARGEPVDAVFRDALDELFVGDFKPGGEALVAALRARAVTVMNPLAAALADDKALLAPLSELHPAHVPQTRVLTPALEAQVRAARAEWVLKPVDGYGGFGIVVGPFVSDAEWNAAVTHALSTPGRFVAQRYVPLPRERVALLDGAETDAFLIHSLWFHPHLAGAFVRASTNPVVNVHQGGGLAPVVFRRARP